MGLVVVAAHVQTIVLNIVTMVGKAVNIIFSKGKAHLHQLVVLVIAHSQRGVDGTFYKQVEVRGKLYPLVIQMLLATHANSHLSKASMPDTHAGTLLRKWILSTARYNHHGIVHRCLQDIHQRHTFVYNLHRQAEWQRGGMTLSLLNAMHSRFGYRWVYYIHIQPLGLIEAFFLGHIITSKLRVGSPLWREDELSCVLLLRQQRQANCKRYSSNK